jgi:hypothetical protein
MDPAAVVSNAEESLATLLKWEKLPQPEREYRFAAPRRWRFDFAWPAREVKEGQWTHVYPAIAVEVEGGSFIEGRHTRGAAFEADCAKYNEAALAGWTVLRVTPKQIESGEAIAWIKRALG